MVAVQDASKPLVSILIPAFNAEEWIAETLASALAQTWEPKEIIVVDDGSSDNTCAVVEAFASRGVRLVRQPNAGAAAARNRAFSLCHGEYIQWLDADDLLAPDKIARQMEVALKDVNKRILFSGPFGRFKYRKHRATFTPTPLWSDLSAREWLLVKLGQNAYMQTATWLVTRELTELAGPWNTMLLGDDDGEYFCRVLLASDGTRFVPEAKVYYRSPWINTLSYVGLSRRKVEAHWRSMQLHIGYLRSLEDSDRSRAACLAYLQSCLLYFYPEFADIMRDVEKMAADLGGRLSEPGLSWKYRWIRRLFGWELAKRAQFFFPRVRWSVLKSWDKTLYGFETKLPTLAQSRFAGEQRE